MWSEICLDDTTPETGARQPEEKAGHLGSRPIQEKREEELDEAGKAACSCYRMCCCGHEMLAEDEEDQRVINWSIAAGNICWCVIPCAWGFAWLMRDDR